MKLHNRLMYITTVIMLCSAFPAQTGDDLSAECLRRAKIAEAAANDAARMAMQAAKAALQEVVSQQEMEEYRAATSVSLRELQAAVDQAEKAKQAAAKNTQAYYERNKIEYDVALDFQKKAASVLIQAVRTYNDSYTAVINASERSQDDQAFLKEMGVDQLDEESEESFELWTGNRWGQQQHIDDMSAITKELEEQEDSDDEQDLARIRLFLQSYEDVTATFEWDDGQKTELFGDFNRIYDANAGLDMHMIVFVEKSADQDDDNQ